MLNRLDALNKSLASELPFPLRVGIGLHHGEAIVGAMGPPRAQITSAIGDTINIAARLEGLTKAHDVSVIFSQEVAQAAGVDTAGLERSEVPVRGRTCRVLSDPGSASYPAPLNKTPPIKGWRALLIRAWCVRYQPGTLPFTPSTYQFMPNNSPSGAVAPSAIATSPA